MPEAETVMDGLSVTDSLEVTERESVFDGVRGSVSVGSCEIDSVAVGSDSETV